MNKNYQNNQSISELIEPLLNITGSLINKILKFEWELENSEFGKLNKNNPYKPFIQSKEFSDEFMKWLIKEMNLKGLAQQFALHLKFYTTISHSEDDNGICFVFLSEIEEFCDSPHLIEKLTLALTEIYKCPIEIKITNKKKLNDMEILGTYSNNKIKVRFINEKD